MLPHYVTSNFDYLVDVKPFPGTWVAILGVIVGIQEISSQVKSYNVILHLKGWDRSFYQKGKLENQKKMKLLPNNQ